MAVVFVSTADEPVEADSGEMQWLWDLTATERAPHAALTDPLCFATGSNSTVAFARGTPIPRAATSLLWTRKFRRSLRGTALDTLGPDLPWIGARHERRALIRWWRFGTNDQDFRLSQPLVNRP